MHKFAVFGNPIEHSISPRLHNLAIEELGLKAFYGRVLLDDGKNLKSKFNTLKLNGANITVPFKEVAYEICDKLDIHAKAIGSVNTIVKNKKTLIGYNTDATGFMKAIEDFKEIKSALIIGAGGTAKALSYALKNNAVNVTIVNRSKKRKDGFENYIYKTWDDFSPKGFDLVVNTTSAGLVKDEYPMPFELLKTTLENSIFAFDVIYNRATNFLNLADSLNLTTKNGSDMLIWQAVYALNLFYDKSLNEHKIYNSMKKAINL
ncbi:MAG: shikimate dehydrogenase [Campylobacter sp.]|nr:shikimate dehydrogenase [Campylobacter sp.]